MICPLCHGHSEVNQKIPGVRGSGTVCPMCYGFSHIYQAEIFDADYDEYPQPVKQPIQVPR